jgi:ribosomal protein S18 acetylase RimI-like enzyme
VKIREDSWLSERFGHPVFSVTGADGLAEHAAHQGVATYQARIAASDVGSVAALEASGMRVVNMTLTLTADPSAPLPQGGLDVRDVEPERDRALLDVAARSFRHTRFHLDPDVPRAVADRIKRDWVGSYLNGLRGERLLVAVRDDEPVGFLAVLERDDGDRRVGVIDLVGVAPEARGLGAGRSLVRAFHEQAPGRWDAVEVGTQAANTAATAFYERLGYVAMRTEYDLHMHVR